MYPLIQRERCRIGDQHEQDVAEGPRPRHLQGIIAALAQELGEGPFGVDQRRRRGDRDPALALEIHGIHDPIAHMLVLLKGAGLTQKKVDESGLAMVDMGDDADISVMHEGCLHYRSADGEYLIRTGAGASLHFQTVTGLTSQQRLADR